MPTNSKAAAQAKRSANSTAANRKRHANPRPARHPGTGDRFYTDAETEFLSAIQAYKDRVGVPFPSNCELLKILLGLGYHKD